MMILHNFFFLGPTSISSFPLIEFNSIKRDNHVSFSKSNDDYDIFFSLSFYTPHCLLVSPPLYFYCC